MLYDRDSVASRRSASLPRPKSRSRNSWDINSRNDTSRQPRHPHHRGGVRAKPTDSNRRVPRAVWRKDATCNELLAA